MTNEFPDLTSFGTLLLYAQALEGATGDAAAAALEESPLDSAAETLVKAKRLHTKRGKRLEQLRRERLNEVVLQPLTGLSREAYLPRSHEKAVVEELALLEDTTARFYRDALTHAADVLGGLERTFARFARESEAMAASLRG